jgi:hypothetical protein
LKDLIQRVLHHPDFKADEVDHDMHERLMRAVEEGDIEVIDMWEEGDGHQENTIVKRKVSKVLMELLPMSAWQGISTLGSSSALMQTATGYLVAMPMDH